MNNNIVLCDMLVVLSDAWYRLVFMLDTKRNVLLLVARRPEGGSMRPVVDIAAAVQTSKGIAVDVWIRISAMCGRGGCSMAVKLKLVSHTLAYATKLL